MKSRILPLLVCLFASTAFSQPPEVAPQALPEHQWLKKFVGQWTTHSTAEMGPGQPPMECAGTIHSRMLGELWVVNDMKSETAGAPMVGLQTIGYDPEKGKYVGTWVDSMVNHLWHYQGTVNSSGRILTLEAEGPNLMAGGEMTKFQDVYEFKNDDEIIISAKMLDGDGQWITFMTGTAKRIN